MKRLLLMCAVLAAVTYVGCRQGEGDRCQVNEDCESGLCNVARGTCSSGTEDEEPIDAIVPDGIDAPPDAPPDAAPDADES